MVYLYCNATTAKCMHVTSNKVYSDKKRREKKKTIQMQTIAAKKNNNKYIFVAVFLLSFAYISIVNICCSVLLLLWFFFLLLFFNLLFQCSHPFKSVAPSVLRLNMTSSYYISFLHGFDAFVAANSNSFELKWNSLLFISSKIIANDLLDS